MIQISIIVDSKSPIEITAFLIWTLHFYNLCVVEQTNFCNISLCDKMYILINFIAFTTLVISEMIWTLVSPKEKNDLYIY